MLTNHLISAYRKKPSKMPLTSTILSKLADNGEIVLHDVSASTSIDPPVKDAYRGRHAINYHYSDDYLQVTFREKNTTEFVYDRGSAILTYRTECLGKVDVKRVRGLVQISKSRLVLLDQEGNVSKLCMKTARITQKSTASIENGLSWMTFAGNAENCVRIGYQLQGECRVVPNDEITIMFDLFENKSLKSIQRETCQGISNDLVINSTILTIKNTPILVYFWALTREIGTMAIIKGRLHKLSIKLKMGIMINMSMCPGPKSYESTKRCLVVMRNNGLSFKWQQSQIPTLRWMTIKLG